MAVQGELEQVVGRGRAGTGAFPILIPKRHSSPSTIGAMPFSGTESTLEYEVEHPRWRMAKADQVEYECDVAGLYGDKFVKALSREPVSAFMAEGSAVVVRRGVRL